MKAINSLKISSLTLLSSIVFICFGCKKDDPTNEHANPDPDAIVNYDPKVGGFFEGVNTAVFPNDIEPDVKLNTYFKDDETNSISQDLVKKVRDFSMEEFVNAYTTVLSDYPSIDKTSNEFAEKIIDKITHTVKKGKATDTRTQSKTTLYPFDLYDSLTPEEKDLVLHNLDKAYETYLAAQSATKATLALFGENGFKTRSDAFRHSYWNWLMSKTCGVVWALVYGNAHESLTPNNDDKRMDLNNNIIGRRVFYRNPIATEEEAQKVLLNYKLLWINEVHKNVLVGVDYLVYLSPTQSLTVWDDGPSYDDIYDISLDGTYLGTTPEGGSKAFELSQIPSGVYDVNIKCKLDGTKGGCGFQVLLNGALTLSSGNSNTPQIIIQESGTHAVQLTFPTMKTRRVD